MEQLASPIIRPLVQQHARDAAFYWLQLDTCNFSPIVTEIKRRHFQHQLNAHLDGLRAAGEEGWNEALKNFRRWKTSGEAFVCCVLAFEVSKRTRFDAFWSAAERHIDGIQRGIVSATRYIHLTQATDFIHNWLTSSNALCQEAALKAMSELNIHPEDNTSYFMHHTNARLRAAYCQLIGQVKGKAYHNAILNALADPDVIVREEAILACTQTMPEMDIVDELHQLLMLQLENAPQKGLAALLAKRKIEFMARILGLCTACGDIRINNFQTTLDDRLYILMLAYHGDPAYLPYLYNAMESASSARLAFWAICFITGLDGSLSELCLSPTISHQEEPLLNVKTDDSDIGLMWPNVSAVISACNSLSLKKGPLLLGDNPAQERCDEILMTATQAIRFSASWHLNRLKLVASHKKS